jgi:hypothetical protein
MDYFTRLSVMLTSIQALFFTNALKSALDQQNTLSKLCLLTRCTVENVELFPSFLPQLASF